MTEAQTITDGLRRALDVHDATLTFLPERDGPRVLTYARLAEETGRRAARLAEQGVRPGDRVALMLRSDLEFVRTFLAVIAAGAVPTALYPPTSLKRIDHYMDNLRGVLALIRPRAAVALPAVSRVLRHLRSIQGHRFEILTPEDLEGGDASLLHRAEPTDTAFIQCTSGSSGTQKAVLISHRNVVANIQALCDQACDDPSTDCVCSWIPMFHDMGLLSMLRPLWFAYDQVFMEPQTFLRRPLRWLQAISEHKGTIAAVPNFSLELCIRRVPELQREGLDLSSMRLLYNGSEPIRAEVVERFLAAYGPFGFRREAMYPCYGMSESTLAATLPVPGETYLSQAFDRGALEEEGLAVPLEDQDAGVVVVGVGVAPPRHAVCVLRQDRSGLAKEREVGIVLVTGPSVSDQGYLENPKATQRSFGPFVPGDDRRWFDTQDLGFMVGDHLFVLGRADDMLIFRGRNVYPSDVEASTESVEHVRKGCSVAVVAQGQLGEPPRVVVIAEARPEHHGESLAQRIRAAVVADHGIKLNEVHLIAPGTLLKTSSGKVCRKSNLEALQQRRLVSTNEHSWKAMARFQLKLWRERAAALLGRSFRAS